MIKNIGKIVRTLRNTLHCHQQQVSIIVTSIASLTLRKSLWTASVLALKSYFSIFWTP